MTTYYSTQRPIGPGTYPKPQENKVIEIKNFAKKEKIENENISAYGYIKYEKPLMPAAAKLIICCQGIPASTRNFILDSTLRCVLLILR